MNPCFGKNDTSVLRVGITAIATIGLFIVGGGTGIAAGPARPASQLLPCSVSALQPRVAANVELRSAQTLATPAGTPYCRIDGRVITPGANDVNFQVSMPTPAFNGRYFEAGLGGAGGSVQPPRADILNLGFAAGSNDKGTRPQGNLDFSVSSGLCPGCAISFPAQASQQVIRAFYGTSSLVRYHVGCSAGGSDGKGNALNFGTADFDGIVSGANPFFSAHVLGFGRIVDYLYEHPDGWVSPALMQQLEARLIRTYDEADGARDGLIQDDRNFRLEDQVLRDAGLSAAQIAAVRFTNSSWRVNHANMPPGGAFVGSPVNRMGLQWTTWLFGSVPPPWTRNQPGAPFGYQVFESFLRGDFGQNVDVNGYINSNSFERIAEAYFAASSVDPFANRASNLNFSRFRDTGGKYMAYQGVGDAAVTYLDSLLGRDVLVDIEGRSQRLDEWFRLYLITGMDHCGGPRGPSDTENRLLFALIEWVENGRAPDAVIASRPASATSFARTFLLCPEPAFAVYKKQGNVNDASNWRCVTSPSKRLFIY